MTYVIREQNNIVRQAVRIVSHLALQAASRIVTVAPKRGSTSYTRRPKIGIRTIGLGHGERNVGVYAIAGIDTGHWQQPQVLSGCLT